MTATTSKAVRKGKYAPIHFRVERAKLEDGTTRRVLVALDDVASRQCRERKMDVGTEWKAEVRQVRNLEFWRLAHALGGWLADNHDMFEGQDSHSAIKLLQAKSGVGCNFTRYKMPEPLNYTIVRAEPLSLAFDCMDEGEFRTYWDGGAEARGNGGWLGWIRKKLYPGMPQMSVDEIERMIVGRVVQWA